MSRQLENLRNIGIIAHIDAGKTTVTERMLFYSGAKHRVGMVDKGTTETDDDREEQERGITIYSACVTFPWQDVTVNLLDTPGHVDFTAEVERCLRVLDGGVVVFSAREGVEAQSETVWRQADKYHLPRIAFINKMDREGADFRGTFKQIEDRLSANPVAVQIPAGEGPPHVKDAFRGVIDLVSMKMLTFVNDDRHGEVVTQPIPDDLLPEAKAAREAMLEKLYDFCNELVEAALQEDEIPGELIHRVLRDATLAHQVQPVLCGSALHGIGVQPVLDAAARYLPSPAERPPVTGEDPKKDAETQRRPDQSEPFCGLVFKILPAKTGDLYWVRVYSGQLKSNTRVYNPGKDKKENVAQLWHIHATKKKKDERVEYVDTGDIVGVIGPRYSITGDTMCDAKAPILLETIQFPETVISMAIEPESTADRQKLSDTLEMMKRQDPTFQVKESEETGQTVISGMGELHLEVKTHQLLNDFKLNVKVHKPRVSYRETIEQAVEVTGQCHRQIGGVQHFAELSLRLEPIPGGAGPVSVINRCPMDETLAPMLAAAVEELQACGEGGGLLGGFPLMKMRATLLAQRHDETSNEVAFRIAAGDAFEKGLAQAGPVLLEPVMRLDIATPEQYLGDFVGDLQQRRAVIARTQHRGETTLIEAHAPLAELFGYSSAMRSLSQGRANCSMEPLKYAPAPPEVAEGFVM